MTRDEWPKSIAGYQKSLELLTPHFADRPCRLLEVGIYEGDSASQAMQKLMAVEGSYYYGIDIWVWSNNQPIPESKSRAIANLARMGVCELSHPGPRGAWLHGDILDFVATNTVARGGLDVVYIDSSHMPDQTLLESCVCFDLLAPGGFLLWDDYEIDCAGGTSNVRHAVDRFLDLHCNRVNVIYREYQCLIHKLQ